MFINLTALKEQGWDVHVEDDGVYIQGTFDVEPLVFDMLENLELNPDTRDRLTGQVTRSIHSATLFDALEKNDRAPQRRSSRRTKSHK